MTGASLGTHPFAMARTLLVIYNVLPLLIYFVLIARLIERFGQSDWGRISSWPQLSSAPSHHLQRHRE